MAGAITTVIAIVDAALCPSLDVSGVRMGMLLLPWALGLLVGEPIGGATLSFSSWDWQQILTGTILGTATTAVLVTVAVKHTNYGVELKTKV